MLEPIRSGIVCDVLLTEPLSVVTDLHSTVGCTLTLVNNFFSGLFCGIENNVVEILSPIILLVVSISLTAIFDFLPAGSTIDVICLFRLFHSPELQFFFPCDYEKNSFGWKYFVKSQKLIIFLKKSRKLREKVIFNWLESYEKPCACTTVGRHVFSFGGRKFITFLRKYVSYHIHRFFRWRRNAGRLEPSALRLKFISTR